MEKLILNKAEIAERQLMTAIELQINGKDPVSVHNLASSAEEIVHHLLKFQKKESLRDYNKKNSDLGSFNKEHKKLWNFIKHADKDPQDSIDFSTHYNDFLIRETIHDFYTLKQEIPDLMHNYVSYFNCVYDDGKGNMIDITNPELINFQKRKSGLDKIKGM